MATKKTAKKASKKKATKKAAPAAKKRATRPKRSPGLTDEQRASLVRPPADFDDALDTMVATWSANVADVRVPGLTPGKLRTLAAQAQRAWSREDALRQKVEAQLAALTDARMLAEDAAWRAALDVYDLAKSVGRRRPEVAAAFEFMSRYTTRTRKRPDDGGTPPAGG